MEGLLGGVVHGSISSIIAHLPNFVYPEALNGCVSHTLRGKSDVHRNLKEGKEWEVITVLQLDEN